MPYTRAFFTGDFKHVIVGLVCMVCETRNLLTLQYTVYAEPDKGWTVLRLIGVCVCVGGGWGSLNSLS